MPHFAFTTRYNGRARVLSNMVRVCLPMLNDEAEAGKIEVCEFLAIWDTGATHSAITDNVVKSLRLQPTGIRETRHAGGKSSNNTYLVNIILPNKVMVPHVRVTEIKLIPDDNNPDKEQPQLLIGMDIISLGDFAVTNLNGKTTFSFRIPSTVEIDFIPETQEKNVMETGNRKDRRALKAQKRKRRAN